MIGTLLAMPLLGGPLATGWQSATPPAVVTTVAPAEQVAAPASEREKALEARIRVLEAELRDVTARSLRQQQEWIEYTRILQTFSSKIPEPPAFVAKALVPPRDPLAEHRSREEAKIVARSQAIESALRGLLMAEGVRNIDFLEVGRPVPVDGRKGTGPVIGRLLDDRGRMVGMVKANRMRLEPSRSGRTLTIILEDGYESRQGVKRPFESGVRRIFLGSVDPEPWIDAFPDLMDDASLAPVIDDGLWDIVKVRARMARLLSSSSQAGGAAWRLAGLGGIREGELRDVQFAEIDGVTGQVARRLFADIGQIRTMDGGGIVIQLRDGSVRRGDRVAPFLDGRFRLMLPYADENAWRSAELPGLSAPRMLEAPVSPSGR